MLGSTLIKQRAYYREIDTKKSLKFYLKALSIDIFSFKSHKGIIKTILYWSVDVSRVFLPPFIYAF